jgi:hypothetical protein
MSAWNPRAAILLTALALTSGCATGEERSFSTSPAIPAAEGSVRFSKTKNDNVAINLTVKHLANPEKLTPPAANYVVWIRANRTAAPQSIGALKVDKDRSGVLDTETPMHSFEIFITAEGSGQVMSPSGQPLLWTSYSQ